MLSPRFEFKTRLLYIEKYKKKQKTKSGVTHSENPGR